MKVTFSPVALSKVFYVALNNRDVEVAGFLVGRVSGDHVLVTDSLWVGGRGGRVHVELDFDAMAKVAGKLEEDGGDEVIVGWWHSHPGMGADFMSATDIKTQCVWQALFPYAIALIVDPAEYEKRGINKRSCSLYKAVSSGYEAIPFDTMLDLNELVSAGLRSIKRALEGEVKFTLTQKEKVIYKERIIEKTGEIIALALSIWTVILALLFWVLS
ncbi:MAG: Mov34/MPN/PAD-1 family protein [Candidatus Jordarchaeales archaeon]|nr:Mov34/MPN/PAD-1 family protein [Candidatus Jordarchaeia archaeon]